MSKFYKWFTSEDPRLKWYFEFTSVIPKTITILISVAFGLTVGWLSRFYLNGFHFLHEERPWPFWMIFFICVLPILVIYNLIVAFLIRQFRSSRNRSK